MQTDPPSDPQSDSPTDPSLPDSPPPLIPIGVEYQSPTPTPRRSLLTLIADRNPFFLISAVCMLWGCLALTNSSSWNSLPLPRLLLLIATLNIYEIALIALAVILLARKLTRDGNMLLILEAFFLVDVAFLNAEVVTTNLRVGVIVNAVLLVLAGFKLWGIGKALPGRFTPARYAFILLQLLTMLALPCWFRSIDNGTLPPLVFYIAWWIVGMMPAVGMAMRVTVRREGSPITAPLHGMALLFVGLPWIALVGHLSILHYDYDVPFSAPMATPLLLGYAIVLGRLSFNAWPKKDVAMLQALCIAAAVFVSASRPESLTFYLFGRTNLAINTLSLSIAVAYFIAVFSFFLRQARWLVPGGILMGACVEFGPTPAEIHSIFWQVWQWIMSWVNWIMPKTAREWGVVSVAASFFFLVVGGMISLKKGESDSQALR